MPFYSELSLSILLGLLCIVTVWLFNRRFPDLREFLHLFLTGGIFYSGLASFYYAFTGDFTDADFDKIRLLIIISGIVLVWFGADTLRKHIKRRL